MTYLDSLDSIDWASLSHAYGRASDVPKLIRTLASSDPADRQKAVHDLFGNIWHQGTVYEASAYAVPFLIELVADERVGDRQAVLSLLGALASGSSFLDAHARAGLLSGQEQKEPAFSRHRARELEWVDAARAAVATGVDRYERLVLRDPVPDVRSCAAHVLGRLVERRERTLPVLTRALHQEADGTVRTAFLWVVGGIGISNAAAVKALRDGLASADVREQFAAAASLARLGQGTEPAVVQALSLFAGATWFRESCLALPWDWSAEVDFDTLFQAVSATSPEETIAMLVSVLGSLDAYASAAAIHDLMELTFGRARWRRPAGPSTPLRRLVLNAVMSATVWQVPSRLWFLSGKRSVGAAGKDVLLIRQAMLETLDLWRKESSR